MGLAGDDAPKSYFPTIIGKPKQPGQMIGMDQKDIYIGHEVTSKEGVLDLSRPIIDGQIVNMPDMEKMWHHGFFNELQMTPEDSPILLTETPGNSKKNREDLIQVMFEKFNVSSFYLALQQVLALYASGKTTGVVLDSGYSLTSTVPIYEGFALSHAIQKMNLAGKHLTDYLMELMKEENIQFSNIEETARSNARDTKEKVCYVAADFEGSLKEFSENPNKSIIHKLPDGNEITISTSFPIFRKPGLQMPLSSLSAIQDSW
jgi:actin-related protein